MKEINSQFLTQISGGDDEHQSFLSPLGNIVFFTLLGTVAGGTMAILQDNNKVRLAKAGTLVGAMFGTLVALY